MLSYAPTSLNASKLFRRSYLSLVSLGAPSTRYSFVPLLYQSLCDYYKCWVKKDNRDALTNRKKCHLFERITAKH